MLKKTLIAAAALIATATLTNAQYAPQEQAGYGQQQAGPQMARNQFFQFAVLPSFQPVKCDANGIVLGSTRLHAAYGLQGIMGAAGNFTPQAVIQAFVGGMQMQNVRVVGAGQIQPTQGFQQAAKFDFMYSTADGVTCRLTAIVNTASANGRSNAAVQFVAAPAQIFAHVSGGMMEAAMQIGGCSPMTFRSGTGCTNGGGIAGNAGGYAPAGQPAATGSYNTGGMGDWHPSSTVPDGVFERGSRVMRDQYPVYDDQGNTGMATGSQFNPAVGGVENPAAPGTALNNGTPENPE